MPSLASNALTRAVYLGGLALPVLLSSACSGSKFESNAGQDADGGSSGLGAGGTRSDASVLDDGGTESGASDASVGAGGTTVTDARADTGGSVWIDAGSRDCDAPGRYYPDSDEDGYGRGAGVLACERPGGQWAERGGDCNDDNAEVHPDQEKYFETPYVTSGGDHSFDYDCSGREEGDPSQPERPPTCTLLACSGAGYIGNNRTAAWQNPVCGSTAIRRCVSQLTLCSPMTELNQPAKRCR